MDPVFNAETPEQLSARLDALSARLDVVEALTVRVDAMARRIEELEIEIRRTQDGLQTLSEGHDENKRELQFATARAGQLAEVLNSRAAEFEHTAREVRDAVATVANPAAARQPRALPAAGEP